MPPTFLQAMHRASAELGQALKSPEKATVASEAKQLPGSLLRVDLWQGSWLLQLSRRGSRQGGGAAVSPIPFQTGCKTTGEGKRLPPNTQNPPSALPAASSCAVGAGHTHSGPKGLRACICLKKNKA